MNASQPVSLEDSSFFYILLNFECFSPDHVALLPTGIRTRLFLHLPLADLCKLEGTPAVAGIDMNQVWHEAATDACKLKGNSISEVEARLMLPVKVYGIDTTKQLWEDITRRNFAAACPSTRREFQQGQGYKQFCNEMVFEYSIFGHYGSYWPDLYRQPPGGGALTIHNLLVTLRCCCGPSHPLVSLPSETTHPRVHGVVPPHYSTVASSEEELFHLALSCFGSPTRLRLWTFWFCKVDEQYLTGVVGNLEELSIGIWDEMCVDRLNKLLSSAKNLISLHIEFFRLEYLLEDQKDQLDIKSLPLSLRKVHIENPGRYSLDPLLPLASFLAHQPDIQLTISGGEAAALFVTELVNQTLNPTPLHFQYTTGSWSYTSDHQSVLLEDVCVPESLVKRYNFTQLGRKRQQEEIDN